jgi:hypothetical protein
MTARWPDNAPVLTHIETEILNPEVIEIEHPAQGLGILAGCPRGAQVRVTIRHGWHWT